jgi:hypothetical protein
MDCSPIAIAPEMFSAIFDCPNAQVAHWDLTRNQFKKGGFVKLIYIYWLVVESPLLKKKIVRQLVLLLFPIYGKIKFMFQTTNQYIDI